MRRRTLIASAGAIATLTTEELGRLDFTPEGLNGKP